MIRALLVDDEQLARERLRRLLTAFDDLEVVGEAEDGEQAVEQILELKPNLVFRDIQMPGCSGMEVAASIPSTHSNSTRSTTSSSRSIAPDSRGQ